MCINVCVCVYIYICIYIYIYIYTYIHTHTHICIYTRTHARRHEHIQECTKMRFLRVCHVHVYIYLAKGTRDMHILPKNCASKILAKFCTQLIGFTKSMAGKLREVNNAKPPAEALASLAEKYNKMKAEVLENSLMLIRVGTRVYECSTVCIGMDRIKVKREALCWCGSEYLSRSCMCTQSYSSLVADSHSYSQGNTGSTHLVIYGLCTCVLTYITTRSLYN